MHANIFKCHPSIRAEFRSQAVSRLQAFSESSLRGALRAWRRYLGFLARLSHPSPPPLPADPANLSVFWSWVAKGDERSAALDGTSRLQGGGSGAQAVRSGLAFLARHLEMPIPVKDIDVISVGGGRAR